MTRVLAFDLGFRLGYGMLASGRNTALSGSHGIPGSTKEGMGEAFRGLRTRALALAGQFKPTALAIATPFIGKKTTPVQMLPMMGFACKMQEIADELGLPLHWEEEPAARNAFLPDGVPRKSKDIKDAVMDQCRARGWPVCDSHAGDALCVADFVLTKLSPAKSHERMPLFVSHKQRQKAAV